MYAVGQGTSPCGQQRADGPHTDRTPRECGNPPRTGDSVHGALAGCAALACLGRYRDPDFTAEVYARADGDLRSVAEAGGIA
jgi:hypothetical protein